MSSTKVFNFVIFIVVCVGCGTYAQYDFDGECRTPNGESANCISIYDCPLLLKSIRSGNPSKMQFLKNSHCGYDRDPLVCCGSDDDFETDSSDESSEVSLRGTNGRREVRNTALPGRNSCGFQETDKILGGENADMDEFPWMARLQYQNATGHRSFACGGSLISPRYVLTAAHCLTGEIVVKLGRLVSVRLGEWNANSNVDCVGVQRKMKICNDPPVDVGIESAIPHERYNVNDDNRHNDIGIVRLNRKVSYSNFVRPICLPLPNEASRPGEGLFVSGWGRTLTSSKSAIKQKLRVPFADKSSCSRRFSSARIQLSDGQICAGGEKDKDSCRGDSGGPLMTTTRGDPSQWYIEGIVSFGANCGTFGWPGVYTKVSSYLNWISQNVRN
uniref:CLIP domain-containing serine protease n=1 Tax=Octodonta nipae TaxID=1432747 RepID=A0A2D0XV03_9CUCU|nr:prophenoloxidase activating factor 1 [Octodonta nipae]